MAIARSLVVSRGDNGREKFNAGRVAKSADHAAPVISVAFIRNANTLASVAKPIPQRSALENGCPSMPAVFHDQ